MEGTNAIRFALRKWDEDSLLRAWFDHFDDDRNGFLEKDDFLLVSDQITRGDPYELWANLDYDKTGYVSLREISEEDARLWFDFKAWCGSTFNGTKDMMLQILGTGAEEQRQKPNTRRKLFGFRGPARPRTSTSAVPHSLAGGDEDCTLTIGESAWTEGLQLCGWTRQTEELFYALKDLKTGLVDVHSLNWIEHEVRKHKLKQEAKRRIGADQKAKAAARKSQQMHLSSFKAFLKKHFGPTYHAWRKVLDVDGTMNLQKPELFKVCRQIGWKGDSRMLWQALDNTGNGSASLEELDPSCARLLARFKDFGDKKFGTRPAIPLWRAIDKRDKQRISYDVFVRRCTVMRSGLTEAELQELSHWLDWQGKKHLAFTDIEFLDHWRPPAYLVAEPNQAAADHIRSMLITKYGHYLKAWRTLLDKDSSNVCNWDEFNNAMRYLKFHGDVGIRMVPASWHIPPGYGLTTKDLSGSITLEEIDSQSSQLLMNFKDWADSQFGSVRAAFKVLDKDRSGELSLSEFRHAVLSNGFSSSDEVRLFKCLDCSGHGRLLLHEVHFLDEWEPPQDDDKGEAEDDLETTRNSSIINQSAWTEGSADSMYSYATIAPGPGAYDLLSGFGAQPRVPTARHAGAHTFGRRPGSSWVQQASIESIGPGAFERDPKDSMTQRRHKPAWQFTTTARMQSQANDSPGPGHYHAQPALRGPEFSFGSRRGFTLHPLQKPPLSARTTVTAGKYCFG